MSSFISFFLSKYSFIIDLIKEGDEVMRSMILVGTYMGPVNMKCGCVERVEEEGGIVFVVGCGDGSLVGFSLVIQSPKYQEEEEAREEKEVDDDEEGERNIHNEEVEREVNLSETSQDEGGVEEEKKNESKEGRKRQSTILCSPLFSHSGDAPISSLAILPTSTSSSHSSNSSSLPTKTTEEEEEEIIVIRKMVVVIGLEGGILNVIKVMTKENQQQQHDEENQVTISSVKVDYGGSLPLPPWSLVFKLTYFDLF